MKLPQKIIFLSLFTLLLTSCVEPSGNKKNNTLLNTDFELIRVNNQYSIELPTFMKESEDLNEDASLEYQNIFKETYTIVIDESKEDFISAFKDLGEFNESLSIAKNYKNIQLQFLGEEVSISRAEDIESSTINGLPFEITEVDATIDGIDIGYTLAFVEGENYVYMVMAWTLQNKHDKYRDLFQKIVKSFKVISRRKGVKKSVN
ncbi:hypothetical protein [Pontimicrobium sp. SW4]|uniref:Tfp pilus assembly protein, major pilin PilA n=1 Tax=Pontimicrobium sp. SW4 TaxID=3153519 RepID=A0AAU7BP62_9FLAO